jgi:phage FluMu protein Com
MLEDPPMTEERADDQAAASAGAMLDGNVAAGPLAAVLGTEMTAVPGRCAHCGDMHMIGEMRAYIQAPGTVLRCPSCDGVILRIVETVDATYVDARGIAYLRFQRR